MYTDRLIPTHTSLTDMYTDRLIPTHRHAHTQDTPQAPSSLTDMYIDIDIHIHRLIHMHIHRHRCLLTHSYSDSY
jgi:hypothetical protein